VPVFAGTEPVHSDSAVYRWFAYKKIRFVKVHIKHKHIDAKSHNTGSLPYGLIIMLF
jgi:hypothetical protein